MIGIPPASRGRASCSTCPLDLPPNLLFLIYAVKNYLSLSVVASTSTARAIQRVGELLKQIPAGKAGRPGKVDYVCIECGEQFGAEVWHCPVCDHHHGFDRRLCNNCHKGKAPPNKSVGAVPLISRDKAAREAGLSRDQKHTALRVASVPKGQFDELVESDNPPTITRPVM